MTNIFLSVFETSMSVSLVIAILLLLSPFLNKRYAAKWKYLIWIFLALRLILPFRGTDLPSAADILSQIRTWTASESENNFADASPDITPSRRVIVEIPAQMTTPIAMQSGKSSLGATLFDIAAIIWMTGALIFLSIHLISYLHYNRQVRKKGNIIKDPYILLRIFELKRELHIKNTVCAIEYPGADSPMVIGFLKPVLVLPKEHYSPEELYFILKHELIHLKRKDVCFKLLFMTANAVHWFNPFIWIMQKEAAVDMELSCDEKVTQGKNYDVRKAYTETLLSTLHKQCTKRIILSTGFYGGKKIMKKRFQNILGKRRKKNGISILLSIVILTISLGTLVGCSIVKEDAGDVSDRSENTQFAQMAGSWMIDFDMTDQTLWGSGISMGNRMEISETGQFSYSIGIGVGGTGQCENKNDEITVEIEPYEEHSSEKEILTLKYVNDNGDEYILMNWHDEDVYWKRENIPAADGVSAENSAPENTITLTFSKEGETEEKQASLVIGNGYSLYLPDDEWQQSDSDIWTTAVNEQVRLWVTHFENESIDSIDQELTDNGYVTVQNYDKWKQEGELIYHVSLKEFENDVWGIFYCYPVDAEDGWGRELPVIADTFAISIDNFDVYVF